MLDVAWGLGLDQWPPDPGTSFVGHRETAAEILERSLGEDATQDSQHCGAAGAAGANQENSRVRSRPKSPHVAEVEVQRDQESAVSNNPAPQQLVGGP